jgi:hypothetical protein
LNACYTLKRQRDVTRAVTVQFESTLKIDSETEVGKVTLKSNGDEVLSDEFLIKSNGDEALNDGFL